MPGGSSPPEATPSSSSTRENNQSLPASDGHTSPPPYHPNPLVAMMLSDPVLALKLQNPDVMQALEEVRRWAW